MTVTRRIYFSAPQDCWLTEQGQELKWELVKQVEELGYEPLLWGERESEALDDRSWGFRTVDEVVRRCVGAVILGLPRWRCMVPVSEDSFAEGQRFATEYSHYEGGVAHTLGLPTLILAEDGVELRGVFYRGGGRMVPVIPENADRCWLMDDKFRSTFSAWKAQLGRRRDVFLGYCSSSAQTAEQVKQYLESNEVGATVLDWRTDFAPAGSILTRILEAVARCSAGIFMFTKDDKLGVWRRTAAPRDNVVFEAGVFVQAKGKERVLIVREKGAKMPADLGGDIYAEIQRRTSIDAIKGTLRTFVERL